MRYCSHGRSTKRPGGSEETGRRRCSLAARSMRDQPAGLSPCAWFALERWVLAKSATTELFRCSDIGHSKPSTLPNVMLICEQIAKHYKEGRKYGREEFDKLIGDQNSMLHASGIAFVQKLVAARQTAKLILNDGQLNSLKKLCCCCSEKSYSISLTPTKRRVWRKLGDRPIAHGAEGNESAYRSLAD